MTLYVAQARGSSGYILSRVDSTSNALVYALHLSTPALGGSITSTFTFSYTSEWDQTLHNVSVSIPLLSSSTPVSLRLAVSYTRASLFYGDAYNFPLSLDAPVQDMQNCDSCRVNVGMGTSVASSFTGSADFVELLYDVAI